jgi:3-oxoacyl-[acyl-carrier-protein] synthase-1
MKTGAGSIEIIGSGMVTGLGRNAAASCAAIRCAMSSVAETRFMDDGGEWILGSQAPLGQSWRGITRLVKMAASAIQECLAQARDVNPAMIPLLLCVSEKERPGRTEGLEDQLLSSLEAELGVRFHSHSTVIARGRVAGGLALLRARELIQQERLPLCIIAGVDSYLTATTLSAYEQKRRLLTSLNGNGFIPGEAAAAILVGSSASLPAWTHLHFSNLACLGIGTGWENAAIEAELPFRADGMVQAFKAALLEAGKTMGDVDYRITDINGEHYGFKEAVLAVTRTLRERKEELDLWHPADCIGEIGAAAGPCALGVALAAARKKYAPGRHVLCHFSADDGERIAMLLGSAGGNN